MVRGIKRPRDSSSLNRSKKAKLTDDSNSSLSDTSSATNQSSLRSKRNVVSSKVVTARRTKRRYGSSSGSSSASNNSYRRCTVQLPNKKLVTVSTKLLANIRHLQMMTSELIPKMPFSRLIRELLQEMTQQRDAFRMQPAALNGLQVAAEYYITTLFEDSNKCAMHAKRITLMPLDMKLVMDLRSAYEPNMVV